MPDPARCRELLTQATAALILTMYLCPPGHARADIQTRLGQSQDDREGRRITHGRSYAIGGIDHAPIGRPMRRAASALIVADSVDVASGGPFAAAQPAFSGMIDWSHSNLSSSLRRSFVSG